MALLTRFQEHGATVTTEPLWDFGLSWRWASRRGAVAPTSIAEAAAVVDAAAAKGSRCVSGARPCPVDRACLVQAAWSTHRG